MRRLLACLLLSVAAPAGAGALEERLAECQEANADCREDCTTSYGSSFKLREKLGLCLNKCTKRNDDCRGRHLELDQAGIDEDNFDRKRPDDEATRPQRRSADVPSVPRQHPRGERPQGAAPQEDLGEQVSDEEDPAQGPTRTVKPEPARPARSEPARDEPSPPPQQRAARPAPPAPAAEENAEQPAAGAADDEAAREGAKRLMKKGIEEWDPNAE